MANSAGVFDSTHFSCLMYIPLQCGLSRRKEWPTTRRASYFGAVICTFEHCNAKSIQIFCKTNLRLKRWIYETQIRFRLILVSYLFVSHQFAPLHDLKAIHRRMDGVYNLDFVLNTVTNGFVKPTQVSRSA